MPGFIDSHYFGAIVERMLDKGFSLFAFVQVSTDEGFSYHVPTQNARDTRMFFHVPNKSLIVALSYDENDYSSTYPIESEYWKELPQGHWTVSFYHQFVDGAEMVRRTYIADGEKAEPGTYVTLCDSYGWTEERELAVPLYNTTPSPTHFAWRGNGEMCELYCPETPTAPEIVVDDIWCIVEPMLPYLDRLPFDELQVTSFPPHYTFPSCEAEFWKLFKESVSPSYLRSLIRRPWGSEGLQR